MKVKKSILAILACVIFIASVKVEAKSNLKTTSIDSGKVEAKSNSKTVFIDAGHGGYDNGSAYNGYLEDNINLQIANKVKYLLNQDGINVIMSRKSDKYVSLNRRVNMSNNSKADLFVSIHQNAHDIRSASGIETFYMGESNKKLASVIQKNIIEHTSGVDRKIKIGNLQVLRDNKIPAVLVECGFISNRSEGRKLNNIDYQYKIANGIVEGIEEYLNIEGSSKNGSTKTALNNVNVMSNRSSTSNVIGRLNAGDKVEVIDTKFDWHKIIYNGKVGYVSGVYVK